MGSQPKTLLALLDTQFLQRTTKQRFVQSVSSPTRGVPRDRVKLRVCLEGRPRVCMGVGVCVRREGMGKEIGFVETKLFGKPPFSYRWPASRMRQATAVMSAAPLPLPSSDCRKVTSHLGDSCFTVSCMTVEKLQGRTRTRSS